MILAWQNRTPARGGEMQSRLLPSDTTKTLVSVGAPKKKECGQMLRGRMPRCWRCQRTRWQRIVTLRDALLEEVGSLLGGRRDAQSGKHSPKIQSRLYYDNLPI